MRNFAISVLAMFTLLCAAAVGGWVISVTNEPVLHEEAAEPIPNSGSLGAVPPGVAKQAIGIFRDDSLAAIVAVWPDGAVRIVSPGSPSGQVKAVMDAARPAPHTGIVIASQCAP